MLLREAWDSISPSTIAACWLHSKCLSILDTAQVASESHSYHRKVEPETIEAMYNKHSSLTLGSPSVANMLDAMGHDVVANVAKRVHDKATTMLSKWLHLEEMGFIDVDEEGDDSEVIGFSCSMMPYYCCSSYILWEQNWTIDAY